MSDLAPSLPASALEERRQSVLSESQKRSLQIAKSSVKIRKLMFSLEASPHSAQGSVDPPAHRTSFTSALGFAASCLPEMKQISSHWGYPVNPLQEDVILHQTLRRNRESALRFVQAAGTLARALGGKIQTASSAQSPALSLFERVMPIQFESGGPALSRREDFAYTFLKSIILWLDGGTHLLTEGFKRPPDQPHNPKRFLHPDDADESIIHDRLIPHLLEMASNSAIPNVDASRFERDATRQVFESESAAVIAFSHAIRMPCEDLSRAIMPPTSSEESQNVPPIQDKKAALKFWGFKVGRGVLMNAGEGVNFQFVDLAFGGLGNARFEEDKSQEDIDPNEEDPVIKGASLIKQSQTRQNGTPGEPPSAAIQTPETDTVVDETGSENEVIHMDDLHDEIADRMAEEDANNEVYDDDEDANNDGADSEDEDGEDAGDDEDITAAERSFIFHSTHNRSKLRERVESDVPCHSHTRAYRGHCNVKTVKDANFFGLEDEYVVSGSDGGSGSAGHVFIWDRKTSQLVNILEGDSDVVNVIQGM